jgi:hypothetical protein
MEMYGLIITWQDEPACEHESLLESLDFQRVSKSDAEGSGCSWWTPWTSSQAPDRSIDARTRNTSCCLPRRRWRDPSSRPDRGTGPSTGQFLRPLTAPVMEGPRLSRAWLCSSLPLGMDAADDAHSHCSMPRSWTWYMVHYTLCRPDRNHWTAPRRTSTVPAPGV